MFNFNLDKKTNFHFIKISNKINYKFMISFKNKIINDLFNVSLLKLLISHQNLAFFFYGAIIATNNFIIYPTYQ